MDYHHQYSDQDHALIHVDDNNKCHNNELSSSSLSSVVVTADNNNTKNTKDDDEDDNNDVDDDDDDDENDCVDENKNNTTTNKVNNNVDNDQTTSKIKKIRFPDDEVLLATIVAIIPNRDDITPEEYDILYFTKNEYQICRSECKLASRDASRSGFGNQCLTNTFIEKPSSSSSSKDKDKDKSTTQHSEETKDMTTSKKSTHSKKKTTSTSTSKNQVNESSTKNDTTTTSKNDTNNIIEVLEHKLCRWTCELDTKRGLERWCDKEHGDIRQREQFQAIMNVLEAQDDIISSMNYNNKTSNKDGVVVDIADKLRRISYKSTKASRYYARMIGKADSFAVLHIDCIDPNTLFMNDNNDNKSTTTTNTASSSHNNSKNKNISDNSSVDTNEFGDDYSFVVGADEIEQKKKKKTFIRRFRFTTSSSSSKNKDTSSSKK